eukprot:scaffold174890_cov34-Tisochrysis_lutea.AAC.1
MKCTKSVNQAPQCLEALAVNNRGTRLIVLLLRDPHLLEGGERGEDGATDPDGVLALRRCDDLDLHRGRCECSDLLRHTVRDAGIHGGATGEHNIGVEVLADVDIALHDRVVGGLVHTRRLHAEECRLEERLRAAEALIANCNDLAVGKFIRLLEGRR